MCLERLLRPAVAPVMARFVHLVVAIAEHPVTLSTFQMLAVETFSHAQLKEKSNLGLLYLRRRWFDMGNWRLALLYQLCVLATRMSGGRESLEVIVELEKKWCSLRLLHVVTEHALERQGDVMECLLDEVSMTGDLIPEPLKRQRRELLVLIGRWFDALWDIDRVSYVGDPPWVRHRPAPGDWLWYCFHVHWLHRCDDPVEMLAREEHFRQGVARLRLLGRYWGCSPVCPGLGWWLPGSRPPMPSRPPPLL